MLAPTTPSSPQWAPLGIASPIVVALVTVALLMTSAKKRLRREHGDDIATVTDKLETSIAQLVADVALRSLPAVSRRSGFFSRLGGPSDDMAIRGAVADEIQNPRLETLEKLHQLLQDRRWISRVLDSLIRRCHLIGFGAALSTLGVLAGAVYLALSDTPMAPSVALLVFGVTSTGVGLVLMAALWLSVVRAEGRISDMLGRQA